MQEIELVELGKATEKTKGEFGSPGDPGGVAPFLLG
jgi:hypothetical protein